MNGTEETCIHEYKFDKRTLTLTIPRYIQGVCLKCGQVIKIKYSDYKKLNSNNR